MKNGSVFEANMYSTKIAMQSNIYLGTFGGCISGERDPPQYCNTGELKELILSACSTAL